MMLSIRHTQGGMSLIEVSISLVIAAVLLTGLGKFSAQVTGATEISNEAVTLKRDAQFALGRMVRNVGATHKLLIPTRDNPNTVTHPLNGSAVFDESLREQTVPAAPGFEFQSAVLAVALPEAIDFNKDDRADADNDKDGALDEDAGADWSDDNAPGLIGIDDDGDGTVDEGANADDDEDGQVDEDPINQLDDDGDGRIDEDFPADMDGSGGNDDDADSDTDEDGFDPIVYFLSDSQLIERYPNALTSDGLDFSEAVIAENVTALSFRRTSVSGAPYETVTIKLSLSMADTSHQEQVTVRVGGAR